MLLDQMSELLSRHARPDLKTAIEGVHACRFERTAPPVAGMSGTVLAVIAQGGKRLALHDRLYDYGPGQYLVTSVDLPVTGRPIDTGTPTLAFGMVLSPSDIAGLLLEADPRDLPAPARSVPPGIAVTAAPAELLDAIVRLLRLLDRPADRTILAPLIKKEILWLLLRGEQGAMIRQLGLADSTLAHISRAARWIREHYADSFRVEDLARQAGMSASTFHRNFATVTGMSPIQFQKQVRLQEARLLLAGRPSDITGVGHAVGYHSASQFSREYRRMFGVAPSQDSTRLRALRTASAPALP
ncbi:AraC family transcriptional regulator [Streptomyces thermodiastaticus]|jgi:AraC-like DNA-binding protein|uniref:AraC family transcriptional regulator n=1 Tax=Streptomyces thermodiastaticus TaxID=44061 RepID=UPI00167AE32B|nr:AraC family transcriptional regulator [Streptomyces thermodiastaticus]MCE7548940.1 AraC family transcriptional regulator [Streptomyces thermodiastaticus]